MNSKIYRIDRIAVLALIPTLLFLSCGKTDNPEANKRDSKGNTVLMKAVKEGNIGLGDGIDQGRSACRCEGRRWEDGSNMGC